MADHKKEEPKKVVDPKQTALAAELERWQNADNHVILAHIANDFRDKIVAELKKKLD